MPAKVVWPNALQVYPECLEKPWWVNSSSSPSAVPQSRSSAECMKSCRGPPFYFQSWESTLAWAACYTASDLGICSSGSLAVQLFPKVQVSPFSR